MHACILASKSNKVDPPFWFPGTWYFSRPSNRCLVNTYSIQVDDGAFYRTWETPLARVIYLLQVQERVYPILIETCFIGFLNAMFYRISISHSTRRLTRSVEHQLGGCETEGSEIVAETAEKSLRNRCFRSSHFSANSTTISASMTDKMPYSGTSTYQHRYMYIDCNFSGNDCSWGSTCCKYGRAATHFRLIFVGK